MEEVFWRVKEEVEYRDLPTKNLWEFVESRWPSDSTVDEWADSWEEAIAEAK